jgi:hypothetical protein
VVQRVRQREAARERARAALPQLRVVAVNVDSAARFSRERDIRALPTFIGVSANGRAARYADAFKPEALTMFARQLLGEGGGSSDSELALPAPRHEHVQATEKEEAADTEPSSGGGFGILVKPKTPRTPRRYFENRVRRKACEPFKGETKYAIVGDRHHKRNKYYGSYNGTVRTIGNVGDYSNPYTCS